MSHSVDPGGLVIKPPQVGQPTVRHAPRYHCFRASQRDLKAPLPEKIVEPFWVNALCG